MLIYECPTCHSKYDAEVTVNRVIYLKNNLRVELKSENQDCQDCEVEIAKEADQIKEEARARVRARKTKT